MKSTGDFGKLGEGGLQVFDDLKLVRFPRSLAPTLVINASPARTLLCLPRRSIREGRSLIPFASFGGDDDVRGLN